MSPHSSEKGFLGQLISVHKHYSKKLKANPMAINVKRRIILLTGRKRKEDKKEKTKKIMKSIAIITTSNREIAINIIIDLKRFLLLSLIAP